MAMTPDQWLHILAKRLDDSAPRIRLLKSYMDGNAPLPEGRENVRESWKRFQRDARTNWGRLILEAVTDRIIPKGILVGGDSQSEVALQVHRIWRDNHMDDVFQDWLRFGLAFGQSYLTCWAGDDGEAVITADSPESMIVATNPLQPWRVRAALRVWRDIDRNLDYAIVYTEDSYQTFTRPSWIDQAVQAGADSKRFNSSYSRAPVLATLVQGKWDVDPSTPEPVPSTDVPVVVYDNPDCMGEYEPHIDLINRIGKCKLDILSIRSMLAFRQRALKRKDGGEPLAQKDEQGNDIDWSKRLEYAPGALWDLPPGIDVWESQATDISSLLLESKDHIRELAAVTRTPLPILMPDNTNTSAAGAIAADAGYISKCTTRLSRAKTGAESILVKALRLEGAAELETLDLQFEPVEMVSTSEKYQAAQAAKAAGESQKAIDRDILGKSPDEIRQDAIDRADEQLRAMALATPAPQPVQPRPQQMPQQPQRQPVSDSAGNGRPR